MDGEESCGGDDGDKTKGLYMIPCRCRLNELGYT
jgi:hypothetical protein